MITHGELDTTNYNPISINELRTFEIANFHTTLVPEDEEYLTLKDVEFNLFIPANYYFDLLNTEPVVGLEESPFKHTKFLKNFKHKPSVFIYQMHPRLAKIKDYSKIFLDQYGRETKEINAKEIILHNV
tara:strand:- start:532 stop:918 length:387 start_codon:yes stop_codon:yes gene_type:complete